jgi:RNA polymerase-binding transcription factor
MNRTTQGLTSTDILNFKRRLESDRREVLRFLAEVEHERRELTGDGPQDAGDLCVVNLSRENLFERGSQKRQLLNLINAALRRIEQGRFGECRGCGHFISRKRLEAMPWTRYCLQCQEGEEQVRAFQRSA